MRFRVNFKGTYTGSTEIVSTDADKAEQFFVHEVLDLFSKYCFRQKVEYMINGRSSGQITWFKEQGVWTRNQEVVTL